MMASGGISKKAPVKTRGRSGRQNLANIPEFVRRSTGLLDPTAVEQPVNRQQRRARKATTYTSREGRGDD